MQSTSLDMIGIRLKELLMHVDRAGLTHKITIVRGQGRQGAYTEGRSICFLGRSTPSIYLLVRRGECTRVYTTVYPRVHNCIHACTLPRSKYVLGRALVCAILGAKSKCSRRHGEDTLEVKQYPQSEEHARMDYVSPLDRDTP